MGCELVDDLCAGCIHNTPPTAPHIQLGCERKEICAQMHLPDVNLDHGLVDDLCAGRVNNAAACIIHVVCADQGALLETKDALQIGVSSILVENTSRHRPSCASIWATGSDEVSAATLGSECADAI